MDLGAYSLAVDSIFGTGYPGAGSEEMQDQISKDQGCGILYQQERCCGERTR